MIVLNSTNITDKSEEYEKFKPFVGNGLLTAPGEFIIILLNFLLEDGMLGKKINSLTNPDCKLAELIECGMDIAAQRIFKLWLHPNIIFYNTKKHFLNLLKINRELTEGNLEPKLRTLLDLLFELSHERGKYSEQGIRDEMNTIIIPGSGTSATTISFVLLMLATFPEIQDKVYEELNQIYCSDDSKRVPITYNNIKSMKLLERMIKETLRLFPAGLVIARRMTLDIKDISAYKITCFMFLPGKNCCSTYLFPFSYGRRNYIGQNFSMLNMTVIIATLIRKFLIKIDNPIGIAEIGLKMSLTLKPAKPIRAAQPDESSNIIQRTRRESDRVKRILYLFTRLFSNDPAKEPLENKE
ncbi:cytochrome P450 4C1-like [Vespa crabro]|uniref:cytochrome P450 4C1-like n=1 Tax=Vespa crabro TaxID=7445 RepID=UPI001F00A11C|nr:cytochrome P450 4C1-like [Vespa crabro]